MKLTLLVWCVFAVSLFGDDSSSKSPFPAATPAAEEAVKPSVEKAKEPGIQDNSFLVEEAYNQEFGVVQHISGFQRMWQSKVWVYTFTQEWPVDFAPRNQLSYTVPMFSPEGVRGGIGDVALNYRYQLYGNGDTRTAFSPRFTLLLPTGDEKLGRGAGGYGYQVALPLSFVVNRRLVTHWNAGFTATPSQKNDAGEKASTWGYNVGQSVVWTARPNFNVLVESVFCSVEDVTGPGQSSRNKSIYVSPGVRWAYNFKNGMQIVPGIAMPIGVGPSRGETGVFLYFSIEHPYRRLTSSARN